MQATDPGPESSFTYLIAKVAHQLSLRVDRAVRTEGLTLTQFSALEHLRARPGVSGADLARLLLISPQAASTLAQRLIAADLVENSTVPSDRGRTGALRLTRRGASRLEAAEQVAIDAEEEALRTLGPVSVEALSGRLVTLLRSLE